MPGPFANEAPRRIAVLRALQLGDMLCTVPALRALRAAFPDADITLIGLPWARSFVERFSEYLDGLMVLPGVPGMPEQPADEGALPAFVDAARRMEFDLAIQLHGSGAITNGLLKRLGAKRMAGFYPAGGDRPDPQTFLPWDEREHEVTRALRLMAFLGIPGRGEALEFPLNEEDARALESCGAALPPAGGYVCVHPGARMPTRRWPAERFAQVADRLARQGCRIVLTGAPAEAELTASVKRMMTMPAVDLGGRTSLGALALLISRARLVVSNDTGVSHVTAAVGTPSVVICSGADPGRWAPLDAGRHRVFAHPVECRPCMHLHCPIGHPCATGVTADAVMAEAERLLDESGLDETLPYREAAFHAARRISHRSLAP